MIGRTAVVASVIAAAGCSSAPDTPPLENGWHVDAVNARQTARAAADERVVYRYEWAVSADSSPVGPAALTEYGQRHLAQIGRSMAAARHPAVAVEPTGDTNVDAARRRVVVATLGDLAVPDPGAVVLVQRPGAYGTGGEEAANVDADTPRGGQTNGSTNGSANGNVGGSAGGSGAGGLGGGSLGGIR